MHHYFFKSECGYKLFHQSLHLRAGYINFHNQEDIPNGSIRDYVEYSFKEYKFLKEVKMEVGSYYPRIFRPTTGGMVQQ